MTPEPNITAEEQMPNSPSASEGHSSPNSSSKRKASSAGIGASTNGRPVKRRASKACQCCRARKVRCNVVEHGAPCTNCRLDEVPCIVTESKRRKKHSYHNMKPPTETPMGNALLQHHMHHSISAADALASGSVNPHDISNFHGSNHSAESSNDQDDDNSSHQPHTLYANRMTSLDSLNQQRANRYSQFSRAINFNALVNSAAIGGDLMATRVHGSPPPAPPISMPLPQVIPPSLVQQATYSTSSFGSPTPQAPPQNASRPQPGLLPSYIKPLPPRMAMEDVAHLYKKGALSIPQTDFRNELLRAYIEFVHPYMPLIELHEFVASVDCTNGEKPKLSLLLFQAVMFVGVAFVDMDYLTKAGFATRKAARKAFYLKARALYDFDYESDRVAIVQALLLMTYWYETPDDQKDTWHWMGVAISLAHTIGLHRNPSNSVMAPQKQKLWKRIWWSCFMRDRLVALGMRRPTRIKDGDFDVPMLTLDDFEIQELDRNNSCISQRCRMIRDIQMQKDLAHLCIAKAKLCLCISHVLSAQYSVLIRDQGQAMGQEGNTRSSVMLFPKKIDQTDEVKVCDNELAEWVASLPTPCHYGNPTKEDLEQEVARGASTLVVQRALLHMCYYATLSALHRPQVLPSFENNSVSSSSNASRARELQDLSRRKVREASREITSMSQAIHTLGLTVYLPTTGVTVLLPAIIIHLLDIKSFEKEQRGRALKGFSECMAVLESLRNNYAAADFAGQFLDAAIRKAGIDVGRPMLSATSADLVGRPTTEGGLFKAPEAKPAPPMAAPVPAEAARLTPPPDTTQNLAFTIPQHSEAIVSIESKLFDEANNDNEATNSFVAPNATTPPNSDSYSSGSSIGDGTQAGMMSYDNNANQQQQNFHAAAAQHAEDGMFEDQFDALINFDHDEAYGQEWHPNQNIDMGNQNGGGMEMGIHGESGGFLVDVDCVWQEGQAEGFTWVAGSPVNGEEQAAQPQQQTMKIEPHGQELSEEERAIFLLKEGIAA